MLDFSHVLATPGLDLQTFIGPTTTTLREWQVWRKPRGVKFIYLIGVGGGGSGGTGVNSATTSGGGAGGGSGAQTVVMIPAFMVPDTLYIQCGAGGIGPTTSGAQGTVGQPTYVAIEPSTTLTANMTLLFANPGAVTSVTVATTVTGGQAGTAAAAATIANMPLAGRGFYNFLAGQIGSVGGSSTTAGIAQTLPATGLMVTGGTGGGGANGNAPSAGGVINAVTGALGQDFFPATAGGVAAVLGTPASAGSSYITRNYLMNYGGTGGGGGTTTAGGTAGAGATGAPGCGGGGGGGATTTNTTIGKGGDGGPGFVLIASW